MINPIPQTLGSISPDHYSRITEHGGPNWVFYGTWNFDGSDLILLDSLRKQIYSYEIDTELSSRIPASRREWIIAASAARLPASGVTGRLYSAPDSHLEVYGSFVDWHFSEGKGITYGFFRNSDGNWEGGFFGVDSSKTSNLEMIYEISDTDNSRWLYLLGNPYVATTGEEHFFVLLGDIPRIYGFRPGMPAKAIRTLAAFPKKEFAIPRQDGWLLPHNVVQSFDSLKLATMPAGLYEQNNLLYLLMREPSRHFHGKTNWSLSVIDPVADRLLNTIRLPTNAPHVTAVPGERYWAFIEKGDVLAAGSQEVKSILIISGAALGGIEQHSEPARQPTNMSRETNKAKLRRPEKAAPTISANLVIQSEF